MPRIPPFIFHIVIVLLSIQQNWHAKIIEISYEILIRFFSHVLAENISFSQRGKKCLIIIVLRSVRKQYNIIFVYVYEYIGNIRYMSINVCYDYDYDITLSPLHDCICRLYWFYYGNDYLANNSTLAAVGCVRMWSGWPACPRPLHWIKRVMAVPHWGLEQSGRDFHKGCLYVGILHIRKYNYLL